jgi:hypothetical protein
MTPQPIEANEIVPGLVLHLDPDVMESAGGTYSCSASLRVQGRHTFLCLDATGTKARWLPLYSEMATRRRVLPKAGRTGHAFWVNGIFHYHEEQVWTVPHSACIAAASAAPDLSTKESRNMLAAAQLPRIDGKRRR